MKIGAVFPTTEIGNDPAVIRDWAQTAEGLGYDYMLTYDHVLGAVHADRTSPMDRMPAGVQERVLRKHLPHGDPCRPVEDEPEGSLSQMLADQDGRVGEV